MQHYYPLGRVGGGSSSHIAIFMYSVCVKYTTPTHLLTASFFIIVVAGNSLFANLISYLQVKVCSTLMQQDLLIMSVNSRLEL